MLTYIRQVIQQEPVLGTVFAWLAIQTAFIGGIVAGVLISMALPH